MTDPTPHTELQSLLRQHLADQEALRLSAELNAALEARIRAMMDQLRVLRKAA